MPEERIRIIDMRNNPSGLVRVGISRDRRLSVYDKLVYAVLCAFESMQGQDPRPSVSMIAEYASCSERQVRRSLAALKKRGYIEATEV